MLGSLQNQGCVAGAASDACLLRLPAEASCPIVAVCFWVECLHTRAWVHVFIYTNFLAWMLPCLCICRVCVNLAQTSSLTVRFCPEALSVTWSHYPISRCKTAPCFRVQLNAQFHAMTLGYAFVTMATAFGDGALRSTPGDSFTGLEMFNFHSHRVMMIMTKY